MPRAPLTTVNTSTLITVNHPGYGMVTGATTIISGAAAGAIHGLPSAATAGAGARAFVTDALAPVLARRLLAAVLWVFRCIQTERRLTPMPSKPTSPTSSPR